jgi:predicted MPP superfamily phosphohydrolase
VTSRRSGLLLGAELAAVGVLGALLGLLVAGSVRAPVGPFTAELSLRPALTGSTSVAVPPLGQLQLDTHDGPVRLDVRISQLRSEAARAIVADPDSLRGLGQAVDTDLRAAVQQLVLRTGVVTVTGATLLGFLVFRRWRATLAAAGAGVGALVLVGGVTGATVDETALAEPRYTGLLAVAPTAVGDVRDIVERFDVYSLQLGRLVANVSELYSVTSRLPVFTPTDDTVRVLSVSDLHLNPAAFDVIASVVQQFGVDVVVDAGDITDHGSAPESRYVAMIGGLDVPYVYVRGNHDSLDTQAAIARQPNAVVLDGPEIVEVAGLRFLGQGDARFTPDKTTRDDDAPQEVIRAVGNALREAVEEADEPPDVVVVHDPQAAQRLVGAVPLVLAGHSHERKVVTEDGTTVFVQGSTGGAGLRALEGEDPTPVMLSVLYLDPGTGELQAYDDITLGGLGDNDARISRTVVAPRVEPSASPGASPEVSPGGAAPEASPRVPGSPAATPGRTPSPIAGPTGG